MENSALTPICCFKTLDETTPTVKTKQNKAKTSLCHLCINLSIASSKPNPHSDSDTLRNNLFYTVTTCDCLTKTLLKNTQVFFF